MNQLSNIVAIARREYLVRARTRSFLLGTALLVIAVVVVALLPIGLQYVDRTVSTRIAVWIEQGEVDPDVVTTIDGLLNTPVTGAPADAGAVPDWTVTPVADVAAARQGVMDGEVDAVIAIERAPDDELQFTLYIDDSAGTRNASFIGRQVTTAVAIADRLDRMGIDPARQADLFLPSRFTVAWPDPNEPGPPPDAAQVGTDYLLGFGLTILIFMLIVLYGNWIAMSVVEEKSSRVMEVILNAATPLQLLWGKVLGVGAVALTQYAFLVLAGTIALLVQAPLGNVVLGAGGANVALPAGLTLGMLLVLGVFGVLGFLLYGVLYAAAGSLVSRQEDVQAAVMPLAVISTVGYLVAVYASTGLLDISAGWIVVLAVVPFVSPFLMLSRVAAGEATVPEVLLAIVLLVAAIAVAMWIAARIYAAGVLLYGQRPGLRSIWRMARSGM